MKESTTRTPSNPRRDELQHQVSKGWYMLSAVTVFSTIGMALSMAPMLAGRAGAVWPWPNTHVVLLCGLVVLIALLVVHLTRQQRRVSQIRSHVAEMEVEDEQRRERNAQRLHALLNISRMMSAVTEPENVFKHITESCLEIFECQQASLMLLTSDKSELVVKASTGHRTNVTGTSRKFGTGIAGYVAKTHEPLILDPDTDMSRYPGLELNSAHLTAAMVVPILVRDELVGVLNASSSKPQTRYTADDLRSLSVFAENAGTVIRHSEHAQWMRQTIEKLRAQLDRLQQSAPDHQPS